MSLARAWMRQLSGASAAALLVPCAVFASIVVLALTGGFAQLRGLGQAFGGPSVPAAAGSAAPQTGAGAAASTPAPLLAVPAPSASAAGGRFTAATPPVPPSGPGAGTPATGPGGAPAPVQQTPPGAGAGQTQTTGTGSPAPAPVTGSPQPPQPPQPPPRPPTLVDQVVDLGSSVTSTLPAPVGPLATQLLQDVGQTLDNTLSGGARTR
jgi:hypothetical protein